MRKKKLTLKRKTEDLQHALRFPMKRKLKLWKVEINYFLHLSECSLREHKASMGSTTIMIRCRTEEEADDIVEKYAAERYIGTVPYDAEIEDIKIVNTNPEEE